MEKIKKKDDKPNEKKFSLSYEDLWKSVIRPPRDNYSSKDLGVYSFICRSKNYTRKDFDILGSNGNILKCTFYEQDEVDRGDKLSLPVIIYLHGNAGSRIDCLKYLRGILENDINLFCFDFAGCGLSEGEYISLGYHEKEDLKIIVNFVSKLPHVSSIGLWGHSMGAATGILYSAIDTRISCLCADSSFSDFNILAKELVDKKIKIPNFIFSTIFSFVRKTIIKKNGLDVYKLKPIDEVKKIKIPTMFVHGIQDNLINMQHSVKLFDNCGASPKIINFFDGGHNTKREKLLVQKILEFFKTHLNEENYQA
jgi:dipeptidyl aminopeptidase/acylaminoacyl peptidase